MKAYSLFDFYTVHLHHKMSGHCETPVEIVNAISSVSEATIIHAAKRAEYLRLLQVKDEAQLKFIKESEDFKIEVTELKVFLLDPNSEEYRSFNLKEGYRLIGFQIQMSDLKIQIEEAFQAQNEAAKKVLNAKRCLFYTMERFENRNTREFNL